MIGCHHCCIVIVFMNVYYDVTIRLLFDCNFKDDALEVETRPGMNKVFLPTTNIHPSSLY